MTRPAPPPGRVSSADLARAAGVSYRRIDHWVRAGYLMPANGVEGSGTTREYDAAEVDVARLLACLTDLGVEGDLLRSAARGRRAGWPVVEGDGWRMTFGARSVTVQLSLAGRRGRGR